MYPIIHNDEKWSTYFIIHHNAWKVKFVLQHFRCTLPSKVIQIINFFWKMFVSVSTKYYLRKIVICIIFVSHSVRKIRYWSCNRSCMKLELNELFTKKVGDNCPFFVYTQSFGNSSAAFRFVYDGHPRDKKRKFK